MNFQVRTPWIKATIATPIENYRLQIVLETGQEMILDLTDVIGRKKSYWRLKNPRYFRQAQIDSLGGIFWPEGEDLAPDGLKRYLAKD